MTAHRFDYCDRFSDHIFHELAPAGKRPKSYYHKAHVHYLNSGEILLTSYGYEVAWITPDQLFQTTSNMQHYTATTCRHIDEFFNQFTGKYKNGKDPAAYKSRKAYFQSYHS